MTEAANWVDTSEFQREDHWKAVSSVDELGHFDDETPNKTDKWNSNSVMIESNGERFFFSVTLLLSCICYVVAMLRYFADVDSTSTLFSYWFTLGTGFGLLSVSQFEGVWLFLARVMKKSSFMVFVCLIVSMMGCCLGGYMNNSKMSVVSSIFQCICLVLVISLYSPSILLFNTIATPKAKE